MREQTTVVEEDKDNNASQLLVLHPRMNPGGPPATYFDWYTMKGMGERHGPTLRQKCARIGESTPDDNTPLHHHGLGGDHHNACPERSGASAKGVRAPAMQPKWCSSSCMYTLLLVSPQRTTCTLTSRCAQERDRLQVRHHMPPSPTCVGT